ncbi:hypothetical protein C8Q77DRAFT_1160100 [Trametes polyzona]|nr:hypothetical protein C8Q77DRAFT_1160100 [Trametes polyzona]
MDAALTPPLRVQPLHVQKISPEAAQKRVHDFMEKYRSRTVAKNSGERPGRELNPGPPPNAVKP